MNNKDYYAKTPLAEVLAIYNSQCQGNDKTLISFLFEEHKWKPKYNPGNIVKCVDGNSYIITAQNVENERYSIMALYDFAKLIQLYAAGKYCPDAVSAALNTNDGTVYETSITEVIGHYEFSLKRKDGKDLFSKMK